MLAHWITRRVRLARRRLRGLVPGGPVCDRCGRAAESFTMAHDVRCRAVGDTRRYCFRCFTTIARLRGYTPTWYITPLAD